MIHIYLRVSTDTQDAATQKTGILAYLSNNRTFNGPLPSDQEIDSLDIIADTASGALSWRKRKLIGLLEDCMPGDKIIAAEVSRIGRSVVDCLDFFRAAAERGVTVIITKSGLTVDNSLASKITTTVLALAAEIEREFLLARTMEGLKRAQAEGVHCGRPAGRTSISKCEKHKEEIAKLLRTKISLSTIARIIQCNRHTLRRYLARQQSAT
jgi:DNA invertase Pin-like site-specific DNA recombinase